MVVIVFSVTDKAYKVKLFEETFVVANVSPEIVFGMLFVTLNGANIDFLDLEFWWRIYTIQEAFLIIRHVKLVEMKKFIAVVLDPEYETFVVYILSIYIASLMSTSLDMDIYSFCKPQIAGLIANKTPIKVSIDFSNMIFLDLASKLSKHPKMNDYTIELVNG